MSGLAERYKPCGATECEYQEVIVPLRSKIERLLFKLCNAEEAFKESDAACADLEDEKKRLLDRLDNITDEIEQLSVSIHSPDWLPSEEEERQKSIEESAGRLMKLCVVEGQCPKCGNKNCDGKGNYCVVERQKEA